MASASRMTLIQACRDWGLRLFWVVAIALALLIAAPLSLESPAQDTAPRETIPLMGENCLTSGQFQASPPGSEWTLPTKF